jgi:protein-tyrosine phosphatase
MRVLFVCLGNICRSPTAEAVLRSLAAATPGLQAAIYVDSAGTADYHVGEPPDPRSIAAGRDRGYDLSALRARQLAIEDFEEFDLLLAMDRANLAAMLRLAPARHVEKVRLFLDYAPEVGTLDVPDPYYGSRADFDRVLDLVEIGSRGLLASATRS